ncbi:hypothetical protein [Xenorhabdus santafensis]|uniref:hypothetical protein n=1 Tax=Xenorhabdus santafensis TaxID=2582833 RepID=UPI0029E80359|nr:hypothetical protein [Xenorhabdus sp. 12]
MEKVNDTQKITNQVDKLKQEPVNASDAIQVRSEAFRKALLRTQAKYADIIKALEDK